jgi:hypothetical protein
MTPLNVAIHHMIVVYLQVQYYMRQQPEHKLGHLENLRSLLGHLRSRFPAPKHRFNQVAQGAMPLQVWFKQAPSYTGMQVLCALVLELKS